jgi:hypothetical protein
LLQQSRAISSAVRPIGGIFFTLLLIFQMARVFKYRNFGVYVGDERGVQHHMPHAHIKERGSPVCTVHLISLEPMQPGKQIPPGLRAELEAHQQELIEKWEELNS